MSSPLPLTTKISQASVMTRTPRVTSVAFGNGYEQRSSDGLNALADTWNLVWENIGTSDLSTLTSFFDGLLGVTYFTFTAPTDSVSKNWVQSEKYTISVKGGNVYTFSCPIKQVFDL
jgi:phage-related protein